MDVKLHEKVMRRLFLVPLADTFDYQDRAEVDVLLSSLVKKDGRRKISMSLIIESA